MATDINHYIAGQRIKGKGERRAPVFNPATGEESARVQLASTHDVNTAVAASLQAFPDWAGTPPLRRARVLLAALPFKRSASPARACSEMTQAAWPAGRLASPGAELGRCMRA